MSGFRFSATDAETVLMGVLTRRDALRLEPDFDLDDPAFIRKHQLDATWMKNCVTAYSWGTRSPTALFLCGLLARATDSLVDPLSIQEGSGEYGYNAAGLWANVIVKHASGTVSLRRLKNVPFNNSPFNGKRRLETNWMNVSQANIEVVSSLHAFLSDVARMSTNEAETALLSALLKAPAPEKRVDTVTTGRDARYPLLLSLVAFADAVTNFIALNSDDGRRAQAFVAACMEVTLPGRTTTPASIHDPSRTSPGDVKSLLAAGADDVGPWFVEVKDKVVRLTTVETFLKDVHDYDPEATAGYAALANTPQAEAALPDKSRIPSGPDLTRSTGVAVVVWKSPLEILTQAVSWSGLPVSTALWLCAHAYLRWLDHIDTGKNRSLEEWRQRMQEWGFLED